MEASQKNRKKQQKVAWWSRVNAWLHLWLGISSGIVVVIVALTGCLFVFCDDIIDALAGKALRVEQVQGPKLPPEVLLQEFHKQLPDRRAFYFMSYRDPQRTFKVGSSGKDDRFQFTWMDPYTGKVLKSSGAYYFFYVVAHVHSGEMPFGEMGGLIVQIATWIFLVELITGLILWWPKKWTKATKAQAFKIKWKASFKRVNYDLHNVPGFYSLLPGLLLTVTGLIIVNKSLNKATHSSFGGQADPYAALRKVAPAYESGRAFAPLQPIIDSLLRSNEKLQQVRMGIPAKDSITTFYAMVGEDIGLKGVSGGSFLSVNRYTGEPMVIPPAVAKGLAIDGTIMNLHIGFWGGWWGKILTFIVGLICASLPITGFLIWWGRGRKKSQGARRPAVFGGSR